MSREPRYSETEARLAIAKVLQRPRSTRRPLDEILIEGSTYSRNNLKARLYKEGLKEPVCELCGQGEIWRGRPMATLDTHCGRARRLERVEQSCERCGRSFRPNYRTQRYCSRECGMRWIDRAWLGRAQDMSTDRRTRSSSER